MGVPNNRILLETKASNTGENVTFSYNVLKILNLVPRKSIILVHTPYMERRTYATFMKQWPEMITSLKVHVTSPPIPLKDYPAEDIGSLQVIIGVMLGCLQRIMVYPSKGYHIYQRIPDNVREAYEILIKCNLFNNFTVL